MHSLSVLIARHPYAVGYGACWLLSNLAETMPKPNGNASRWYIWAFQLLHSVAGAIPRLVALTMPPQYARVFNTNLQGGADPDKPKS